MIPDHLVARIPELQGRRFDARPLPGGLTNRSFLLEGEFGRWVLRLNGTAPGIDRQREARVLESLADTTLGPTVLRCDPAAGYLLYHHIEGVAWTTVEVRSANGLARLGRWLAGLHRRPYAGPELPAVDALRGYLTSLGNLAEELAPMAAACRQALAATGYDQAPRVLCHGDVNAANVIDGPGGLRLIDWEFAGGAPAELDLGLLLANHDLSLAQGGPLLDAYGGEINQPRMVACRELAQLLNRAWRLLHRGGPDKRCQG